MSLIIKLENWYFVPTITKKIIFISYLNISDFSFNVKDKCYSFCRDEIFYGRGTLQNGIYILDIESSVMSIKNKKHKNDNLNITYLWHCRLGHINEKRISKLHRHGYLGLTDFESLDEYESCQVDKMTKFPFTRKGKRAVQLLGLIYIDVPRPMSITAKDDFSYFITFIDDHSRYGYVYSMKFKHETLKKFKDSS